MVPGTIDGYFSKMNNSKRALVAAPALCYPVPEFRSRGIG
jgi:hypothetical protein